MQTKKVILILILLTLSLEVFAKKTYARVSFKPTYKKDKGIVFLGKKARLNFKRKAPGKRHKRIKRKLFVNTNSKYGVDMTIHDSLNGGRITNGIDYINMNIEYNGMPISNGTTLELTNRPNDGIDAVGQMTFSPDKTTSMHSPGVYKTVYTVTISAK